MTTRRVLIVAIVGLLIGVAAFAVSDADFEAAFAAADGTSATVMGASSGGDGSVPEGEITDRDLPPAEQVSERSEFSPAVYLDPAPSRSATSLSDAFERGYRDSGYMTALAPTRVLYGLFTDLGLGEQDPDFEPQRLPGETPEERAASARANAAAAEAAAQAAGEPRRVVPVGIIPKYVDHPAWVFVFDETPYQFPRGDVRVTNFMVVVDAESGEFMYLSTF